MKHFKAYPGGWNATVRVNIDAPDPVTAADFIRDRHRLKPETEVLIVDRDTGEIFYSVQPPEAEVGGRKGRPALNINLKLIYDTLKSEQNVKAASLKLGCSRGYIYKIVGVDVVRQCLGVKS